MGIHAKLFPQFQHLSSDGNSMIAFDVPTSRLLELDYATTAVVEEAAAAGVWTPEVRESAQRILQFRGISSEDTERAITQF